MTLKHITLSLLAALVVSGFAVTASTLSSAPAVAQATDAKSIVDAAKAKGLIGETAAGYLAIVGATPSDDIVNAMNEINIKRKGLYTRKARATNEQVEVIATLTGEKVIARAPAGQKVMTRNGTWITAK